MIKKGKNLKIGDLITKPYAAIIIGIDVEGIDPFFDKEPTLTSYDLNDCLYGPGTGYLDVEQDHEVETDRKKIMKAYKQVRRDLAEYIVEGIERHRKFMVLNEIVRKNLMEKQEEHKS